MTDASGSSRVDARLDVQSCDHAVETTEERERPGLEHLQARRPSCSFFLEVGRAREAREQVVPCRGPERR